MSKHTPGPWEAAKSREEADPWGIRSDDGYWLASIIDSASEPMGAHSEVNARLMAAAPDLLLALREIAADYADRFDMNCPSTNPGIKYVVEQARAAIAKATGESA